MKRQGELAYALLIHSLANFQSDQYRESKNILQNRSKNIPVQIIRSKNISKIGPSLSKRIGNNQIRQLTLNSF